VVVHSRRFSSAWVERYAGAVTRTLPLLLLAAACSSRPAADAAPDADADADADADFGGGTDADVDPDIDADADADADPDADADRDSGPAAYRSNCEAAGCTGGVDYYSPDDPERRMPFPVTPEREVCLAGDRTCGSDEAWLRGEAPGSGNDLDDLVGLFAPERRDEVRAYLSAPGARVLVVVGGWGGQHSAMEWMLSAAAWVNLDERLQVPIVQLGYYAPCDVCVTEYGRSQANGVEHARLLQEKLLRAGADGVYWMGHSEGCDVVQGFVADDPVRPGLLFAWGLAAPNLPPIAQSWAVPPTGPDPANPTGGFFLYGRYTTLGGAAVDYGGRFVLFNRASDCATNGTSWAFDCVDLDTHEYRGVLRSASFREALWAISASAYPFTEELHGDADEGHADRTAGVTFDCIDDCP
jgi:hypothetical protein